MNTITVFNPWTKTPVELTVSEIMDSIKVFASIAECEEVNNSYCGDSDEEWVKTFEAIHGVERLSEIALS